MRTFWVVVADAGRALMLSKFEGAGASKIVHDLENPAGRMRTSQLVSDEPSRAGWRKCAGTRNRPWIRRRIPTNRRR
jgi:hypothetical protein